MAGGGTKVSDPRLVATCHLVCLVYMGGGSLLPECRLEAFKKPTHSLPS